MIEGENVEPDQFRKTRIKINELNEDIKTLADKNDADSSKAKLSQAHSLLETLDQEAEGEIQNRSVKNLKSKLKFAAIAVGKIKPGKSTAGKSKKSGPTESIVWDNDRLARLSDSYLTRLMANAGENTDSQIYISATGKGVKPSYQIDFGSGKVFAFSGSTHKQLKRKLPGGPDKISKPFSLPTIQSILDGKN